MSVVLDKVNTAPIQNDDFSYEFKQWVSNTIDTLNEVISDIEDLLISRETVPELIAPFAVAVNSLYIPTGTALSSFQLPVTTVDDIGSIIEIDGLGAGGWQLLTAPGQTIKVADVAASAAVSITSGSRYDSISIILVAASTWITRTSQTAGFVIV